MVIKFGCRFMTSAHSAIVFKDLLCMHLGFNCKTGRMVLKTIHLFLHQIDLIILKFRVNFLVSTGFGDD